MRPVPLLLLYNVQCRTGRMLNAADRRPWSDANLDFSVVLESRSGPASTILMVNYHSGKHDSINLMDMEYFVVDPSSRPRVVMNSKKLNFVFEIKTLKPRFTMQVKSVLEKSRNAQAKWISSLSSNTSSLNLGTSIHEARLSSLSKSFSNIIAPTPMEPRGVFSKLPTNFSSVYEGTTVTRKIIASLKKKPYYPPSQALQPSISTKETKPKTQIKSVSFESGIRRGSSHITSQTSIKKTKPETPKKPALVENNSQRGLSHRASQVFGIAQRQPSISTNKMKPETLKRPVSLIKNNCPADIARQENTIRTAILISPPPLKKPRRGLGEFNSASKPISVKSGIVQDTSVNKENVFVKDSPDVLKPPEKVNVGLSGKIQERYESPTQPAAHLSRYSTSPVRSSAWADMGKVAETARKNKSNAGGYPNLGNTCYMNSVLQALRGLLKFSNDLKQYAAPKLQYFSPYSLHRAALPLFEEKYNDHQFVKSCLQDTKQVMSMRADQFAGSSQNSFFQSITRQEIWKFSFRMPMNLWPYFLVLYKMRRDIFRTQLLMSPTRSAQYQIIFWWKCGRIILARVAEIFTVSQKSGMMYL